MLYIDLKARLRNWTFWTAIVALLLGLAKTIAEYAGFTIPVEFINNIVNYILGIGVLIGIIADPSTPGLSDKKEAA